MPNNTDLIIIATAIAKTGSEAALERALRDVAAPTREQSGCVSWSLYRAGGTLVALERWASRQAHERHLRGAHVQELMGKMATLLAAPPSIVEYSIVED